MYCQVHDLEKVVSQSSKNKAMCSQPLGEEEQEDDSPTKKKSQTKKTKQSKLTDGLTAEERALDDSSNNGDNNRGPPQQSNKGKWKASNSYNFNPRLFLNVFSEPLLCNSTS